MSSVVLHECAHGWTANRLGDPTAKMSGRLTLNPLKHIDPFGTILLPILLVFLRSPFIFGWAKPVPVNFMNLRNPKKDMLWVGIAGPAVNVALAIFFSFFLRLNISESVRQIMELAVVINLVLATFNMIPIPPLDGSRLIMSLLPYRLAYLYGRLERYGIFIVLILLYLGLLREIIWPPVFFFGQMLGVHF